jgi:UDPglucose 6-dehydrogenase
MTKYAINAFLATKVAWFNQLYDLCDELGLDFESIRNHIIGDPRIGDSHTQVTKERGFGGACFPKDTLALMYMTKNVDTLSILDCAIGYNDTIKSS